ncbi:MAG: tetratricopeptide repeat protein [Candidatus Hinthialibacter sp.]
MNMKRMTAVLLILSMTIFIASVRSQEEASPPPAPWPPIGEDQQDSLLDFLQSDFLRRYQDALSNQKTPGASHRAARPNPELGRGRFGENPSDLSQFIDVGDEEDKPLGRLRELTQIPPPQDAPPPQSATATPDDVWANVASDKRFEYAQDLLNRRKYDEAQRELERFLSENPSKEDQFNALILREKCLFHRRFYGVVQDDYYRLKNFYPLKEKEILTLKSYMEEKSGVAPLQKKVLANPADPAAQHELLSLYEKLGWLDFAEDFFLITIQDTSAVTAKSLCEVYFKKQDYEMLANLCRAARDLHPSETAFLYNEGVALYHMGDPASLEKALELFQRVFLEAVTPSLRQNAQWYIDQLSKSSP